MTDREPVALFAGLAAVVGLAATTYFPDVLIPDEVTVLVVAGIACVARKWVTPWARHVDALEEARKAVAARKRSAPARRV